MRLQALLTTLKARILETLLSRYASRNYNQLRHSHRSPHFSQDFGDMVCVCQIFRSFSIHTVFLLLAHAKRSLPWIQWPRSCLPKWYLQSNTSWIDLSTRFIQTLSAAYWWVLQHPLSKDWNLTLRQVPGPKPKAQQKAKLQVVYLKVRGILKSFVKHQRGPSWKWILAVKMLPPRLFDLLGTLGIAMNSYE